MNKPSILYSTGICPVTLTPEAQKFILGTAKEKDIPLKQPLRIKHRVVNEDVLFDLWHDTDIKNGEKVYDVGELKVVLDNDTAFHLVGSILDVLENGSLKFTHLDNITINRNEPN